MAGAGEEVRKPSERARRGEERLEDEHWGLQNMYRTMFSGRWKHVFLADSMGG